MGLKGFKPGKSNIIWVYQCCIHILPYVIEKRCQVDGIITDLKKDFDTLD